MRKGFLLLAGAGAVLLAACSGDKKASINDDLKKDLELASSSDGITLANSSPDAGQQVVSAIEQTTKPSGQKPASSNRVRTHRAVHNAPPQVVKAPAPATVTEIEPQTVAQAPAGDDPTPVSARPQPVAVSYPGGSSSGGDDGRVSSGGSSGVGAVLGTILGAVIRGGVVGDDDDCDPRTDGRHTSVNNRIPFPTRSGGRASGGTVSGGRRSPRF
jgi:hypothetical protein